MNIEVSVVKTSGSKQNVVLIYEYVSRQICVTGELVDSSNVKTLNQNNVLK
jgi:hypothetical protein